MEILMLHKANALPRHPRYGFYTGGVVNWRTAMVHYVAKAVGLLVKVEGMPLGSRRNLDRSTVESGCSGAIGLQAISKS